jgi:hypothetical protein
MKGSRNTTVGHGKAISLPALANSPAAGEILFYRTEDGKNQLQALIEDETVWLSQAAMGNFFQTTPQNITLRVKHIYREGELSPEATCKDYLQVGREGGREIRRSLKHANLDMILSVGYRARFTRDTQFRHWAYGASPGIPG